MDPVRSLLYIPANNRDWVENGPFNYDADGFIFDLEDSVPPAEKPAARDILYESYELFDDTDAVITARVNPPETGEFEHDLKGIAHPRLDAIIIPKVPTVDDINRAHHILEYIEKTDDITDQTEIIVLPETAIGMKNAYELCATSDRVAGICGGTSRGADVERALGWEWTPEGDEKLYMLSKIVMDARAAGLTQMFGGAWLDIEDIDGLTNEATKLRQLGYTGYQVIHPSHVDPVNEVFTPDLDEVEHYQRLVEELDAAELEENRAAVRFEGEMIDIAHIKTAKDILERARSFGLIE